MVIKKVMWFVELLLDTAVGWIWAQLVTLMCVLDIYNEFQSYWIFRMFDRGLDAILINAISILKYEFDYDGFDDNEDIKEFLSRYGYEL